MYTETRAAPDRGRPDAPAAPPRRVLFALDLEPGRKFGSMEEQALLLARACRDAGGLCLPLFNGPAGGARPPEFAAAGLPAEALDLRRFRPGTLLRLLRLVRRQRIDVVHWNFYPALQNAYLWGLTLLAPRVQHYFTDHISRPGPAGRAPGALKAALKRVLLRRYRRVVCVSRHVLGRVEQERAWRAASACLHFINTERFKPDAAARALLRGRLGVPESQFVVVCVAQLIPAKGLDVALRALAELPDAVHLWLAGDGPEAARLRGLATELGVAGRVRFLGLQKCVEPYLQAADCFACPSLWEEAAGLVNLEAQACGLPVVASRVGGIPEYVAEGVTGFLFPPGEHRAMAACVRRLSDGPHACRAMGDAAREWAVRRFSPAARLGEYLDLYRAPY
ncbi:MAG TPA: glycosyltransferase [Gemmataceae bacterium]|nr:glycosyltransferase [Gemmataceae bacterium]